jgi:CSLREA domain-containing protein
MFMVNVSSSAGVISAKKSIRILISIAFTSALTLAFGLSARAATITVNSLGDALVTNGQCTLREAIINANNNAASWPDCATGSGIDVINLPAGTITLTIGNSPNAAAEENLSATGDLDITSSLTINGNAGGTTIDAATIDRIFDINSPLTPFDPALPAIMVVALNNLTATNGYQNDVGSIRVATNATVTMDGCTVSNSTSRQ